MILSFRRLSTLLRSGLLALLVMGVVIKPMLAYVCELHSIGHVLSAYSHGHEHADSKSEHRIDQDHASGAHGFWHEGDSGGAYADIVTFILLPTVRYEPLVVPFPTALPVPLRHATGPFRPPIA